VLAIVFVLLGDLNQLATLSSMPFLITYAFVNYAYCSLAMSNDLANINKGDSNAAATYGSNEGGVSSRNPLDGLFSEGQGAEQELEQNLLGGQAWYSKCINRYVSFTTAIIHIVVVIFINKWFAFLHLVAFALLYVYLGGTCQGQDQGLTQFSILHMIRVAMGSEDPQSSAEGVGMSGQRPTIVPQEGLISTVDYTTSRLNEANDDYGMRKPYHHAEHMGTIE